MELHAKRVSVALLCAVGVLIAGLASRAWAVEESVEHVYDASRSLTGDCSTTAVDPVPDPGLCPIPPGTVFPAPNADHPSLRFNTPCGSVTDSYGDIYVANEEPSHKNEEGELDGGRIDVFDAAGEYLTEIRDQHHPCDLAVDSEGHLYVLENFGERRLLVFTPPSYPPQPGAQYPSEEDAPVVFATTHICSEAGAIAVDPSNDHLYVRSNCEGFNEYASADENLPGEEWDPLREGIAVGLEGLAGGMDVYGKNHYIYNPGRIGESRPQDQRVYIIDGATGEKVCEADGSETPDGSFSFLQGSAAIAVDQSNGDFYIDDRQVNKAIDRFDADCKYIDQLPTHPPATHGPELEGVDLRPGLAVDEPCLGEGGSSCDLAGYHSPSAGYVYVGSGQSANKSHLFAFKPRVGAPPQVEEQLATGVTANEAILRAQLNPGDLDTHYRFQYISQAAYEADGGAYGADAASVPVPDAQVGEGASFVEVSAAIGGLQAATPYRFRLFAENEEGATTGEGLPGSEGQDATFATYAPVAGGLPDNRGYELVTPPDTGGYQPTSNELGFSVGTQVALPTDFASKVDALLFGVEGGSIPGLPGGGFHDTYEAHREASGSSGRWSTEFNGIDGAEARHPSPGGFDAARAASFWGIEQGGTATEPDASYVLRPGGVLDSRCSIDPASGLESIGCGSLGTDTHALGEWISPGAGHVIFATPRTIDTPQQLEPGAAPTGTSAVYDRTADGTTHVVSLKPGGGSFGEGENASYEGASRDGGAVAFMVSGTLYVRLDDERTVELATGGVEFGGISSPHGGRVFYLRPNSSEPHVDEGVVPQGEIFLCEARIAPCAGTGAQAPVQIGSGDESVLVNVSADGSRVYFAEGDQLYLWEGSGVSPVAHLDHADIVGRELRANHQIGGLGLWVPYVAGPEPELWQGPASDPSRTTPDGSVLIFESRAELTGYDNEGHAEIYRYRAGGGLGCLSCNPTGRPASSDAQLQADPPPQFNSLPPVNSISLIANVTASGNRVFFQSAEPLVLGDTDGKLDVYEWEAQGEGDCTTPGGCRSLISSGRSASADYLYAMSADGSDVFFESGDRLTPRDISATPSIYDARVGGGEAPEAAPPGPCLGESCQPTVATPGEIAPASAGFLGAGNPKPRKSRCSKGRRRARGRNKARCARVRHRRHHHHKRRRHHGRAKANRRAGL